MYIIGYNYNNYGYFQLLYYRCILISPLMNRNHRIHG